MRNLQWVTIVAAATGIVIAASAVAHAQEKFPTKPIRLVVGFPPGGRPDTLARLIGQKMSESWSAPVVVDNRPGAGGTLAAMQVAKAAPDGHTLLLAGPSIPISVALQPNLPYDALKDFAGITQIGFGSEVLVVTPALGMKSVKDLIALAKAHPGKIIFGSPPVGTSTHLLGARFNQLAGIKVVAVAFKSGQEAMIQVMGGRAHYGITTLIPALPFVKEGKLLALAVTTPQRSLVLPDVPTLAATLPEFKQPESSLGLLAPAGTPRHILNQISKEFARILELADIKERLHAIGIIPAPSTPAEYDKLLRLQIEAMSKLVVDIGLKAK